VFYGGVPVLRKAERDNVAEDKTIACDIYGKEFGYLALE
jgi:hypothetical protein|tara:strand:+ start:452 stop:568 length:117 start_codon:yes stop_codon:yes gene_type:complete